MSLSPNVHLVMSLPVELLDIIFKCCYLASPLRDIYSEDWEDPSLSDTLQNFPYNLAAVDPTWNAILLRRREYWIGLPRVVFNVDSKMPTPIDDAKEILQHMLYEPDPDTYHLFHVAIIRRSKANPDDADEKERVMNLMDLLAPQISRIQGFIIDVHASSSLPSVSTYFSNLITSPLVSLEYLCDVDDSQDTVSNEPDDFGYVRQDSHITSMVLDGGTFRRNPIWLRRHTKLQSLTISHLSHGATNPADLDIQRALGAVLFMATPQVWRGPSNLKYLKFRDIDFAPRDSMCRVFSIFSRLPSHIQLQCIAFEHVDPGFLEDLTRHLCLNANRDLVHPTPMELHLTCGASSRDIPVNVQCTRLVLEGYDQAYLTASYPLNQDIFPSSELHLINCPGFTNSELKILSRVDPETNDPLFSTNLTYLKLTDCHHFTIQALKKMVTARAMGWRKVSRMSGWKSKRLNTLDISGYGIPLSDNDKDWFMSHLKNFSWDGVLSSTSCQFPFLIPSPL